MHVNRQVVFWFLAFAFLILVLGVLKDILLPFIAGIIIAYSLNPLADRLAGAGLNRTVASGVVVGACAALLIALIIILAPIISDQTQQLVAAFPGEMTRFREIIDTWARSQFGDRFPTMESGLVSLTNELSENWTAVVGWLASSLWSRGLAVFNLVSLILVTPLVVFYLLDSWNPMLEKIDGWLPRDHALSLRQLAADMNNAISAFVRGQGLVCLILGVYYASALSWLGLNYGLVIGLATGLFAFVPFVGWAIGLFIALTFAAVQYWPATLPILLVGAIYGGGQALDAALLSPKIVGKKVGLHPVWLLFSLFVFSYLFGFVGMLVAVPTAAAIAVVVRFALGVYLQSSVYRGTGQMPGGAA